MESNICKIFCLFLILTISSFTVGYNGKGNYYNRFPRPPTTPSTGVSLISSKGNQCILPPLIENTPGRSYNVGILAYDNVEVLDLMGPFEVFSLAGALFQRFKVYIIAAKKNIVAQNGLKVTADHVIGEAGAPELNIVIIPGSDVPGTTAAMNNPVNMNWLKREARRVDYLLSVCTGLAILGRAGLVDGLDVTTHHQLFDFAEREAPRAKFFRDRRFTDNGRVLTSAGISAGIDLSLYFVKKIGGRIQSNGVADRMEYDWKDYDYDKCKGPIPNPNPRTVSKTYVR